MRHEHCHRTTGDSGPHSVCPAGKNHRHPRAKDHACTVGLGQEAELFGENVARFKIGGEQDVRITSNIGVNAFGDRSLFADRIVEGEGPVEEAARDLAAFGHLRLRRGLQLWACRDPRQ